MIAARVAPAGIRGVPAHYPLDRIGPAHTDSRLPLGTPAANIVGSALPGAPTGSGARGAMVAAAGIGFRGVRTAFSTFGHETAGLATGGAAGYALGAGVPGTGICLGVAPLGAATAGPFG